jgi:hypothetical protein
MCAPVVSGTVGQWVSRVRWRRSRGLVLAESRWGSERRKKNYLGPFRRDNMDPVGMDGGVGFVGSAVGGGAGDGA